MLFVLIAAAVATAPGQTGPTYLTCDVAMPDGKSRVHLDINLNEATATAGFSMKETGKSAQNIPATFTQDQVTFTVPGNERETISRVTLDITDEIVDFVTIRRSGKCVIAPPVARQF